MISARDKLYLSYQGAAIKDNSERQPSLVLNELMDYLEHGYGWCFDPSESKSARRQRPLQPFSPAVFEGMEPGFDSRWATLSKPHAQRDNRVILPETTQQESALPVLPLEALVRSLAERLAGAGVTVNSVAPGYIRKDREADINQWAADVERNANKAAEKFEDGDVIGGIGSFFGFGN